MCTWVYPGVDMFLILFENRVQWYPVDGWSYFFFLGYSHLLTQSCIYMHIYICIYVAILHVTFCHSYTLIFSHWLVIWNMFYFPYIGNNHPNWLSYFSEGLKPPTSFSFSFPLQGLERSGSSALCCVPKAWWLSFTIAADRFGTTDHWLGGSSHGS